VAVINAIANARGVHIRCLPAFSAKLLTGLKAKNPGFNGTEKWESKLNYNEVYGKSKIVKMLQKAIPFPNVISRICAQPAVKRAAEKKQARINKKTFTQQSDPIPNDFLKLPAKWISPLKLKKLPGQAELH